jgi:ribosomal protein S18 acetylase RimI-like enzyme
MQENNSHIRYNYSSAKISLRKTTPGDIDWVLNLEQDPENSPYIRQWRKDSHKAALEDSNIAHFIIETLVEKKRVGYAILIGCKDPDRNLQLKRIVILDKDCGYGRQAIRLIKDFGFKKIGCHRLWLEVVENYDKAFRLYESENFVREGLLREAFKRNNYYLSLNVMSILESEYQELVRQD